MEHENEAAAASGIGQRVTRGGKRAPLYVQLMQAIRAAIEEGRYQADAALPPERDLADQFRVSRITVRKALAGLADEGLLSRRHGAGNFVSGSDERIQKSLSRITSFSEDMAARNRTPRSEWTRREEGRVTPEEALAFGLSPGSIVYRFVRTRYADDMAMALETATVPGFCLPSVRSVQSSLYQALDQHGFRPVRALQRLRAVNLDPERAATLGVAPGSAALLIERRGFHQDGRLVEVTTSYYRGDAYDFLTELNA